MSCSTYFDPSDLQGSSLETEVGWTTLCIPNVNKMAILLILFFFSAFTFGVCAFHTISIFRRNSTWSQKMGLFLLLTFGSAVQRILQILYLAGVQSRARYLLTPFLQLSLFGSGAFVLQMFIRVNAKDVSSTLTDSRLVLIQRINWGYITCSCISLVLIWGVLPMVYYEETWMLNRFYTAYVTLVMVGSTVTCLVFGSIFHRLSKLLQPKSDLPLTSTQAVAHQKLRNMTISAIAFTLASSSCSLFPLWIGLTARNGDPGMRGIFYYHFCFQLPYHLIGYHTVLYMIVNVREREQATPYSSGDRRNDGTQDDRPDRAELTVEGAIEK